MTTPLSSLGFAEQTSVPAGKLGAAIRAFQHDRQTGLVEVAIPDQNEQILMFSRGRLSTVYRAAEEIVRVEPADWLAGLNISTPEAGLRRLALTPQDVRIFKILIEQRRDTRSNAVRGRSLETQFNEWKAHPVPALAHVRWPKAEALVTFPGQGAEPYYSLFINNDQILHTSGGLTEIFAWKEEYESLSLFSSEPATPAWTEYLLHQAFSFLVSTLMGKLEKLIGRIMLNQIIRDVNFKATAHDWNVTVHASSINDQTIFESPLAAAEVYSRLLEVLFQQFESVLGSTMLEMLVREAVYRLPVSSRQLVKVYLPITAMG